MFVVPGRFRRLFFPMACLLACLVAAPVARATPAGEPCAPADASPLDAELSRLGVCQDSPSWLAWVGERLNRAGRHAEALEHLERALLLEPAYLPARLGYLLALAGSGDTEAALAFAQQLLAEGRLPPDLAGPLAQRVARWQRDIREPLPVAGGARTRLSLGTRIGYDSNLLGAPNLDSLTLILAGQPVQLPLDESYRNRRGSHLRLDAALDHSRLLDEVAPGLRLDLALQARRRVSPQVPLSNLGQGQFSVELSRIVPGAVRLPGGGAGAAAPDLTGWYGSFSAASLDLATGTRFRSNGLGAGLQWRLAALGAPCEARTGAETQNRDLVSNPVLSGNYRGAVAILQCQAPGFGRNPASTNLPAWQLQFAGGTDQPTDPARPGGAQRQALVRLTGFSGPWLGEIELERRRDAAAYSALLGDEIRTTARRAARLEWRHAFAADAPAKPALELRLGFEWSNQQSNLGLFATRNWGPYLSLRAIW